MQHAPAKLPFKLHMFAYVEFLAQSLCIMHSECALKLDSWDFLHVNCRQLSELFLQFSYLPFSDKPFHFHVNSSPVEMFLYLFGKALALSFMVNWNKLLNFSSWLRIGVPTPVILIFMYYCFAQNPTPKWEPDADNLGGMIPKMEVWESDLHLLGVVSPSPKIFPFPLFLRILSVLVTRFITSLESSPDCFVFSFFPLYLFLFESLFLLSLVLFYCFSFFYFFSLKKIIIICLSTWRESLCAHQPPSYGTSSEFPHPFWGLNRHPASFGFLEVSTPSKSVYAFPHPEGVSMRQNIEFHSFQSETIFLHLQLEKQDLINMKPNLPLCN
ncbi:putative signal peptide protein [Puccinia sorghi]|uniref:Putative signal peptide protein n=1 Tax=Puccinia sorghi TaxID=27349 RepID=A0A0L6VP75_9BASI|nr:putative signal peptide protein [Puccinia sorghi]